MPERKITEYVFLYHYYGNLEVVTTTSEKCEDSFAFTKEEVWKTLGEYGLSDQKEKVKDWYGMMLEPLNGEDTAILLEFKVLIG